MHTNYYMNITRAQCAMHNHVIRMGLGEKTASRVYTTLHVYSMFKDREDISQEEKIAEINKTVYLPHICLHNLSVHAMEVVFEAPLQPARALFLARRL